MVNFVYNDNLNPSKQTTYIMFKSFLTNMLYILFSPGEISESLHIHTVFKINTFFEKTQCQRAIMFFHSQALNNNHLKK